MSCVIDFATYSLGTDSPKIEHLPTVFASVIASLENVERCGIDGTPATPPLFFFVLGKAPNLFGGTLNDLVFFTHQKSSLDLQDINGLLLTICKIASIWQIRLNLDNTSNRRLFDNKPNRLL